MNLYWFGRAVCNVFINILFRMKYEGRENVPEDRGFILASNHRSNFDPLCVVQGVKKQLRFMAKAELFRGAFLRWLLLSLGAFPVQRGAGDTGAMDNAAQIVRDGGVLAIFPEGHRSKDGVPLRARSGVGMVAAQTGADVLPCAVVFGDKLRFRCTIRVVYGKLIPHEELGLDAGSPSSIRKASKRIMDDIIALTGYQKQKQEAQ